VGRFAARRGRHRKVDELLHEVPAIRPPARPLQLPDRSGGAVSFQDVTFRYPTRPDFKALNGFSLNVASGEAVALVGPSGAGKSTVFQLMLRFSIPKTEVSVLTASTSPNSIPWRCARKSRWCRKNR
jgi:ATP-binding cassette subfamily B protein